MLTPEGMLAGYARGIFPMAEGRGSDELHWIDPRLRGVMPLDGFRISRSLARRIRNGRFEIAIDRTFSEVVALCAAREETWINAPLAALYGTLHERGHAHSLEVREDDTLVGGVFGLTLGAAFFGESMFSLRRDASKVALAYLVDRLRSGGFSLFDTQFLTPHLASLGGVEIPRAEYHARLSKAVRGRADFTAPEMPSPQLLLQRRSQTS
ncbi:leucyl/phenylalanyl-tRNA--protein transferase [Defluviimonas sp. WL0024]|uniref:Leucyl/phenylalanyl-tRNA--protein transferase n=1 Tax=Albidovulum salinarum TaxID=2984153 RepID=A0ABT2WZ86_9RHOB|nr:leucyl/phenylalanyl-tRNA--protein transferase [Defluviimonas sp. WL0024]MCU9846990.1 leucyl/phenylalanyl-tRNA--protein transferase [Defluviimonas sp. WL0024]